MRLSIILFVFLFLGLPKVWAHKINVDFGYYTMKADSPSSPGSSVSVNSFGVYGLSGNIPLTGNWELSLGYTVFLSKIYKGDMGFGPDFGVYYFPFNAGSGLEYTDRNLVYTEIEHLRPFVGASFHQRQFQSVQSSYSGFGIELGVEFQFMPFTALRALFKNQSLQGPTNTIMKWNEFSFGLQRQF